MQENDLLKSNNKKLLNSGMTSIAYIIDDKYIQLIGKRSDCPEIYTSMRDDCNSIKPYISCVKIPCDMIYISPCEDYLFGSLIYEMIKGSKLNIERLTDNEKNNLAQKIVKFNTELHSADIHWNREKSIAHECAKIRKNIDILKSYLTFPEIQYLEKYALVFEEYLKSKTKFCITHGDLYADNLIIDENNILTGIIDFGNTAYFLPETDYASMWNMDNNFIDRLLKYTTEDVTEYSVILFMVHREVCSFEYILMENSKEKIDCQLDKIKQTLVILKKYV